MIEVRDDNNEEYEFDQCKINYIKIIFFYCNK